MIMLAAIRSAFSSESTTAAYRRAVTVSASPAMEPMSVPPRRINPPMPDFMSFSVLIVRPKRYRRGMARRGSAHNIGRFKQFDSKKASGRSQSALPVPLPYPLDEIILILSN